MTFHVLVTRTLFRAADFSQLIGFSEATGAELSRLSDGERIAVQGALTGKPAGNQRKDFLDHALGPRAPAKPKKRKTAPGAQAPPVERVGVVPPSGASPPRSDDDIPF
jgi:hypothetical protein